MVACWHVDAATRVRQVATAAAASAMSGRRATAVVVGCAGMKPCEKYGNLKPAYQLRSGILSHAALCECCVRVRVTHSLQALETWAGTVYLQSMIMVRVSLSFASWKGGWPHTNMNRITPRLQMSEAQGTKRSLSTGVLMDRFIIAAF